MPLRRDGAEQMRRFSPEKLTMERAESFGAWLRAERRARGLTQRQLGIKIAYSDEHHVRKVEAGRRRLGAEQAGLLAEAWGIPHEERSAFIEWARGGPMPERLILAPSSAQPPAGEYPGDDRGPEQRRWVLVLLEPGSPLGVSCAGEGCNGQDPGASGCSGRAGSAETAEITDRRGQVMGWVELRWSEVCQTNWARVENTSGRPNLHLRTYLRDAAGDVIAETVRESRATGIYGRMWYAPTGVTAVSACAVIEGCDEVCTNPH